MKFPENCPAAIAGLACLLFSFNAGAHALWLEQDNASARLYFGEYSENLRETSPGRLDDIIEPAVTVIDSAGAEKPLAATRLDNYFAIPDGGTILVRALKQRIRDPRADNPGAVYRRFLYARFGSGGSLPLDIENTGNLLRLSFMGKPLAKTEIIVIAPNGWEKHFKTDEKGETAYSLLEPGLYVIEAKHELNSPGVFEGKPYTIESHKVTASFYK
ncbi:MAG: hypothetical protein NTAFB09_24480 [Nitrosospira sp.]